LAGPLLPDDRPARPGDRAAPAGAAIHVESAARGGKRRRRPADGGGRRRGRPAVGARAVGCPADPRAAGAMKALAVIALLAAGAATCLVVQGRTRPYEVTAYVVSAAQVVPGNDVVMGGVPVGQVSAVELSPDDSTAGALIRMQLQSKYAPLHRGTRVTLRPKGLLGNMFVE